MGQAQEYKYVAFPDSNAVWSTIIPDRQDASNNYNCVSIYLKHAIFNEDTVINNITGTLISKSKISGMKSYRLNTSDFPKGIYSYRLTSKKQKTATGKITIR
jgi:hypothetical protein